MAWKIWNLFRKSHDVIGPSVEEQPSVTSCGPDPIQEVIWEIHRALQHSHFSPREAYTYYDEMAPLATVVDDIADEIGCIQPMIYDTASDQFDDDADVLELLRNPGFNQTYEQFIKDTAIAYQLTRNFFHVLHGPQEREPVAMSHVKPFWMTVQAGTDGYARTYNVNTSHKSARFEREGMRDWIYLTENNMLQLNHVKGQTTNDDLWGRSPVVAILLDVLQRISGARHNLALLKNGARLSGILNTEAQLGDDQLERVKERLNDKRGFDNAGEIMIADGGKMSWNSLSQSNKDMDYRELVRMAGEATALRYKYPLALLTPERMTFDNYGQSILALYDRAVLPVATTIFRGISRELFPRFGMDRDRFILTYDPTSIEALQVRFTERMKLRGALGVHTINEMRQEFGDEALKEGGDAVMRPGNEVAVGEDARTSDNPTPESADDRDDSRRKVVQLRNE